MSDTHQPNHAEEHDAGADAEHDDPGGNIRHHEGHHCEECVTIFVNTRRHEVEGHQVSFEEIVLLAYPSTPPGANIGYSVTFQRGHDGEDGQLVAGQHVKVRNGMIFDVTATDLS